MEKAAVAVKTAEVVEVVITDGKGDASGRGGDTSS
jgi:hypothetical protein